MKSRDAVIPPQVRMEGSKVDLKNIQAAGEPIAGLAQVASARALMGAGRTLE